MRSTTVVWLSSFFLAAVVVQIQSYPLDNDLWNLEKQFLYSFDEPQYIRVVTAEDEAPRRMKRGGLLLNIVGPNNRFTEPYLHKPHNRKLIRSVPLFF